MDKTLALMLLLAAASINACEEKKPQVGVTVLPVQWASPEPSGSGSPTPVASPIPSISPTADH